MIHLTFYGQFCYLLISIPFLLISRFVSQPSLLRVAVGTSSRLTGGKTYDVSVIHSHEGFSTSTLEHDIALLSTAKVMDFGETVAPVSVASEHYVLPDGTGAIVSGFGTTSVRFVLSLLN